MGWWEGGGRRGGRVRGQHFTEIKTLNKQKINIHYVYKLQHYEPVGHITQKKNLQYLQSLILKKFSKKLIFFFFFAHLCCTKFYKKGKGDNCTQTFGSVGK